MDKQRIVNIKISDLHLWTENPRDPIDINASDFDIIEQAIKDENTKWKLQSLLKDMGSHYDFSELPTVVESNGKFIVYDGNRRIAILKYLQNEDLYKSFGGGLFFKELEAEELINLEEIPCNVCPKDIALMHIERKHSSSGSWTVLDRDYFLNRHMAGDKSIFLMFEEATGLISGNEKLNQRFVQEEVLTIENLKTIGFTLQDDKLLSVYSDDNSKQILDKLIELIETGKIKTRTEEGKSIRVKTGKLKDAMVEVAPNLEAQIEHFNTSKGSTVEKEIFTPKNANNNQLETKDKQNRKTPSSKQNEKIFGRTLSLQSGRVNDMYLAIDRIYTQNKNDLNKVYPILAMSLRLILDVSGREYFKDNPEKSKKDQLFKDFIEEAVKPKFREEKLTENLTYISLSNDWLSKSSTHEATLQKWAHGHLIADKTNILQMSYVIGDILERFFGIDK